MKFEDMDDEMTLDEFRQHEHERIMTDIEKSGKRLQDELDDIVSDNDKAVKAIMIERKENELKWDDKLLIFTLCCSVTFVGVPFMNILIGDFSGLDIILLILAIPFGILGINRYNSSEFNQKAVAHVEKKDSDYKSQEASDRTYWENEAYINEQDLDYAGALRIWESLGDRSEAKRIRNIMRDEEKVNVDQTVVHGDYVDDRDTIVKDSVINRSDVGSGSKADELREAKALLDEGLINENDYEQMKKEILGKV